MTQGSRRTVVLRLVLLFGAGCGTGPGPLTADAGAGGQDADWAESATTEDATATDAGASDDAAAVSHYVYPLKVGPNGRHLVDQNGLPFLIAGDAPQSLIVNLSEAEAEMYIKNRRSLGFNSLWINLLCNDYTSGRADGSTVDGLSPFGGGTDFSKPNEPYFQRVDHMIQLAARYGFNVFLDPAETGGWLKAMLANGTAKCRTFGQYLGARYGGFDNIVWLNGNDFQGWRDATNDGVVASVALGIKDTDARHIHTVELDYYVSSSLDDPTWVPIVSLNAAYTYRPTYAEVLAGYNRKTLPVFLVEGVYEFESNSQAHRASAATLRRQAYWTNLSGATGQIYGSHYTWTFTAGWQSQLNSPGALQIANARAFLEPRAWYNLVPDQDHSVVTSGYGTFTDVGNIDDSDYVTAARTPDGGLVVAYMPTPRTITVDMAKLRGVAEARWFDPSHGTYASAQGSPFPNSGKRDFTPSGTNADGDGDWCLVIESP
jgi:hypothetical protein